MTDLVQTPADVERVSGNKQEKIAGATITAGMPVYADGADTFQLKPAQADAAATAKVAGMALNSADDEQPIIFQTDGVFKPGATVVIGETYALSAANPGKIAPYGDLVSTNRVTILGVGISTSEILLGIINSEVAKP
jgi:hypothetical protein